MCELDNCQKSQWLKGEQNQLIHKKGEKTISTNNSGDGVISRGETIIVNVVEMLVKNII